jgi:hypothetical protein
MPFEKGESGNPAGRPPGSRNRATLLMESLMADDAEAIGRKAVAMAKEGDLAAIRPVRRPARAEAKGKARPVRASAIGEAR